MGMTKIRAASTAGILAFALVLTGCGSDDAATGSTAAGTSAPVAASTASDDTAMTESDDTAGQEMTSEEMTSEEMSSEDMTSEDTAGEDAATSATTTVGDSSGDLDETSTVWFDTLCTGLLPVAQMGANTGSASDPEALKTLGDAITAAGESMTKTATDLDGLEPPTFDGGEEFAGKIVPGLTELGGQFAEIGPKVAAGDLSSLEQLSTATQSGPLQELSGIDATPETKAAVAKIPSCSELGMT